MGGSARTESVSSSSAKLNPNIDIRFIVIHDTTDQNTRITLQVNTRRLSEAEILIRAKMEAPSPSLLKY
jgi:hypothetical protein